MPSKNILTGVRSNGIPTLGNYLGAILPMVETQNSLQKEDNLFIFLPDLHSFTTPIDYSLLYDQTLQTAQIYLASGINSKRENVYLYRQSHVSGHSELTWILSCFSYFGEMSKMIQFKEKGRKQGQNVGVGLFTYPILMAADILLYNAEFVPLGEDQRQHLELARDLAIRFNHKFENIFPEGVFVVPKPWKEQLEFTHRNESVKIRSLQNPESKMSKSVEDPKGTILLNDDPKIAAKKIMSAVTDNLGKINWDWQNQPGITNLLQILAYLSGKSTDEVAGEWKGKPNYGDLKKAVAQNVEMFLNQFQAKQKQIDLKTVDEILQNGEQKANLIAQKTLLKAQKAVGVKQ